MADRKKHAPPKRRVWNSDFPSYYRDSLRWAMVTYKRREKLGYAPLLNKMENVLGEKRNIVNSAGDRQVTVKVLKGFLGRGTETDDQNIIIMTEFIGEVLPDYIKTFTEEGCETLLGDTYLKFLFEDSLEVNFYEHFSSFSENLIKSTFLCLNRESGDGALINFRKIGNSPHLKAWVLIYENLEDLLLKNFESLTKDTKVRSIESYDLLGTIESANDISFINSLPKKSKLSGIFIPVSTYPFATPSKEEYKKGRNFFYNGFITDQSKDPHLTGGHFGSTRPGAKKFKKEVSDVMGCFYSILNREDVYPQQIENPLLLIEFDKIYWGG